MLLEAFLAFVGGALKSPVFLTFFHCVNLTDFFEKSQNGNITILDGLKSLPTITNSNHCLVYNFINDIILVGSFRTVFCVFSRKCFKFFLVAEGFHLPDSL